jgi:5-methylthioadenosine/S-adenosylhomocysteine deaminase
MIRTDDINLYPSNNALGTVVAAADIKNVDTVIIEGVIRKSGGKIIGVNWPMLRAQNDASRNYLFQGYEPGRRQSEIFWERAKRVVE